VVAKVAGQLGVATSNLLNFIGKSMGQARLAAIQSGTNLAFLTRVEEANG
jgi:hypothetical protein